MLYVVRFLETSTQGKERYSSPSEFGSSAFPSTAALIFIYLFKTKIVQEVNTIFRCKVKNWLYSRL